MNRIAQATIALLGILFCGETTYGQMGYTLCSLDWLVADADVVARGVIVDVLSVASENDEHCFVWKLVTLDTQEILKDAPAKSLKFVTAVTDGGSLLEQWREHRTELLWFLHRKETDRLHGESAIDGRPLSALLHGGGTNLYAFGLESSVMPLAARRPDDSRLPPPIFTLGLRLLVTRLEILEAARFAASRNMNAKPRRLHRIELPRCIAQRTGRSGDTNAFLVPVDERLEVLALRLIQSPGDFLPKGGRADPQRGNETRPGHFDEAAKYLLRREGARALDHFKSDKNSAILESLLDDPSFHRRHGGDVNHARDAAGRILSGSGTDSE